MIKLTSMPVTLSLIALGSTREDIEDRHIILTKEQPVLAVGRSSKNLEKRLQPSKQNAIFDCPIISRQHAQIEIKDLSMV